jgi:hypothetical protein
VIRRLALFIVAVLPIAAAAQEAAPPMPEDPRAPRFHDVERGFFTGFEAGYLSLFKTPTADRSKFPFAGAGGGRSDGFLVGATIGYDVTSRFALSAFALGGNSRASISYGAFSVYAFGGDMRVSLLAARDANQVERLFFYLHGRGGLLVTRPDGLFGSNDVYLAGGPGVEYFTHLRHFSVGLAADVAYVTKAKTAGLALTPTVRYTF